MFSPLARGVGTWDGDLKLEQWDDKLDNLNEEHLHRHGVTVSPRVKSANGGRSSRAEKSNGEIILPKTFVTRKGALMLLSNSEEAELSAKQREYLESCNRMLKDRYEDYVAGVGSLPRLMKSVLIYGDENYEHENISVMDEGNKTCLHFVHSEADEVHVQAQPGGDVSEYLRDLHKARVRSALTRMSTKKSETSDIPGKLTADAGSLMEQFSKPLNSIGVRLPEQRSQSSCSALHARNHRVLSVEKLASSLKSASYLGRPSPYHSMIDLEHFEADPLSRPPTPVSSMTSMKSHLSKSWVLSRSRTSLDRVSPIPQNVEEESPTGRIPEFLDDLITKEQKMEPEGIDFECAPSQKNVSRPSSVATESVALELLDNEMLMHLGEEERDPLGVTAPLHPVYSGLVASSATFSLADSSDIQSVQVESHQPDMAAQETSQSSPTHIGSHRSTPSQSMERLAAATPATEQVLSDQSNVEKYQRIDKDDTMSLISSHSGALTERSIQTLRVQSAVQRQPSPTPSFDRDSLEGSITHEPTVIPLSETKEELNNSVNDSASVDDVASVKRSEPERWASPVDHKQITRDVPDILKDEQVEFVPQPPSSERPSSSKHRAKPAQQINNTVEVVPKIDSNINDVKAPLIEPARLPVESPNIESPKKATETTKSNVSTPRSTASTKKQVTISNKPVVHSAKVKKGQRSSTPSQEQPSKSALKTTSKPDIYKPEQDNIVKDRQSQIQKLLGKNESAAKVPVASHLKSPAVAAPPEKTQQEIEVEKLEKELNELINHEAKTTDGGLSADELALEEQLLRDKMKAAEERLKGSPSTKPTKQKPSTDSKKKKKKKEMSDEKKENLAKQQESLREARQLEKQRRLEEAKKLQQQLKDKEAEQAQQIAEAQQKKLEIEEEIANMAEEAEAAKLAEEDARQVLADVRKSQREEREARRKAEVERRKQEAMRRRDEERRISEAARLKEQEMLARIADADQRRQAREQQELSRAEDEDDNDVEDEAKLAQRIEEEEEEKLAELERQAEEEAMSRLVAEREEAEERRQRLQWAAAQMEREEVERQKQMEDEKQRIEDERLRWEAEQERLRDMERQRLEEFHQMQEEAKEKMQHEMDQRRQAALLRRSQNMDRRSHMSHLSRGQGMTKPWVFSYYVHWPRETFEKLMGEDPKKKKGFGGSRKKKPKT